MKRFVIPIAIAIATACGASHAAVNLNTFNESVGPNSVTVVSTNAARLFGTASLTGNVANLRSFEFDFTTTDVYVPGVLNDVAYFTTSAGTTELADVASLNGNTNLGWRTFTFSTLYSGAITFGVANRFDNDDEVSVLDIRNLVTVDAVPAVPEPESIAMLLAGMGVVGTVARRRRKPHATT